MVEPRQRREHELVCLKVEKVFDSCFHSDAVTISTTALTIAAASLAGLTFACLTTAGTPALGTTSPDAHGCVNLLVTIPFTVSFTSNNAAITFAPVAGTCAAVATLFAPTGTTIQIDDTVECGPPLATIGTISETTVTVTLTTVVTCRIVISSEAKVHLLVESHGFCEIPACNGITGHCSPLFPGNGRSSPR